MRSRKCRDCDCLWPLAKDFSRCPACAGLTQLSAHPPDFSLEDGQALRLKYRFVRFCERRDKRREIQGLPSPEEMGKRLARESIEEAKRLDKQLAA